MLQDDLMISGTESLQYERENFTERERGTSSSENTGENKFSHTVMIEELLASEEARLDHDFIDEIREFRYEPIADAFERSLREAQHRLVPSDPATERAVLDTLTQEISGGIDPWDIDLLDINQPTSTRSNNAEKESMIFPPILLRISLKNFKYRVRTIYYMSLQYSSIRLSIGENSILRFKRWTLPGENLLGPYRCVLNRRCVDLDQTVSAAWHTE